MYISCCDRCKCNLRREVCKAFCQTYKIERDVRIGQDISAARSERVLKVIKNNGR